MSVIELLANGRAKTAQISNSKQALKDRLLRAHARGQSTYTFPGAFPVLGATPRADAASVAVGAIQSVGSSVYLAIGTTGAFTTGTTGTGTAPTGTGNHIVDGSVVWGYLGYLAPVAFANSASLAADQLVYSGGNVYRVVASGTTAASGGGPTPAALTSGTVTFAYEGVQTLPLMTVNAAAQGGFTQRVTWNDDTKRTILGGTMVQNAANARGGIVSRSGNGGPYTEANGEGGGFLFSVSDAPKLDFTATGIGAYTAWVDGQIVALVVRTVVTQHYLDFDFSAVRAPRRVRTFRFDLPFPTKFAGFFATATDTFSSYSPAENVRAVLVADSFGGGSTARPWCLLYSVRLSHWMGIEDFRIAAIGGTGIVNPGALVPYGARFTQDVIVHNPDLVIIQQSNNDGSYITAGSATLETLRVAQVALVDRVRNELPNAFQIALGNWNNRGPLATSDAVSSGINEQARAIALAANIPFVDWSNYLTDGGYVGHGSGTGNSLFLTGDGTHPTGGVGGGDEYRANRLNIDMRPAIRALRTDR